MFSLNLWDAVVVGAGVYLCINSVRSIVKEEVSKATDLHLQTIADLRQRLQESADRERVIRDLIVEVQYTQRTDSTNIHEIKEGVSNLESDVSQVLGNQAEASKNN